MTSIAEVRLVVDGFKDIRELKKAMLAGAVIFRDPGKYSNGHPIILLARPAEVKR